MAVLKCKMCGGDVAFSPNDTVGICEWCGSKSTLPKISDDRLANLFNRANHFRMKGDFDKAEASYEHILEEDNSIAEAHWGAVISRYGIEYVEDPNSHKRVPTCHRASWRSILTDNDYLSAIEYAEENAKAIYVAEAKYIDDVQKRILAISKNEAPYDIFICYKESTGGGSRTKDSVMAQDLYERLQKEGFRVFFARITLEDKLGQEYEPYIFSALNSAKVMLVIGTDADNFNAPWVKNEWSRFIAIMHEQMGRLLIPCYKGMDVYELPEELSVFQCQDMGKIGFEQDLIRGIKKVLRPEGQAEQINRSPEAGSNSLLKRGNMFLADCEWEKASEYFDRVLDIDPECAEAYGGKLCAELQAPSLGIIGKMYISAIKDRFHPWADDSDVSLTEFANYRKALQFAKTNYKQQLDAQEQAVQSEVQQMKRKQREDEINITKRQIDISKDRIESLKSQIDADAITIPSQMNKLNEQEKRLRPSIQNLNEIIENLNREKENAVKSFNTACIISIAIGFAIFIFDSLWGIAVGFIICMLVAGVMNPERKMKRCDAEINRIHLKSSKLEGEWESVQREKKALSGEGIQHKNSLQQEELGLQNLLNRLNELEEDYYG